MILHDFRWRHAAKGDCEKWKGWETGSTGSGRLCQWQNADGFKVTQRREVLRFGALLADSARQQPFQLHLLQGCVENLEDI